MQPLHSNDNIEDTLEIVIYDGIQFLNSLTRHYGPEKGQEVWKSMSDALGKEITGKMFFKMLCGESGNLVRFRAGQHNNAVPVIKAIRVATGLGLKEAKDKWDLSKDQLTSIQTSHFESARVLRRELKELGCEVL